MMTEEPMCPQEQSPSQIIEGVLGGPDGGVRAHDHAEASEVATILEVTNEVL